MNIRCLYCKAVNPYTGGGEPTRAITCPNCGARRLPGRCEETSQVEGGAERSGAELAESLRIDLASANSVLLGLMTLDQARALQHEIRLGCGCKNEFDGKTQQSRKKRLSARAASLILAITIFAAIAVGSQGWLRWQEQQAPNAIRNFPLDREATTRIEVESEPPAQNRTRFEARRNLEGRLTWISAPTPEDVLVAFCRERAAAVEPCDPIEVASTRPRRNGTRLGLLRQRDIFEDYAITIVKNRENGWWFAGTGKNGIDPYVVAPHQIGDRRRVVSSHGYAD
jgi:hypothetical protein